MLRRIISVCTSLIISAVTLQGDQPSAFSANPEDTQEVYIPMVQGGNSVETTSDWIGPGGGPIVDLAYDTVNTNTVYAAASIGGVYKSTDGGITWQKVNSGMENMETTAIGIAATNPQVLYAGTYRDGLYKSDDGGESWIRKDLGFQDGAVMYAVEIDPSRTNRVLVSTRGDSTNYSAPWNGIVYRSNDGGETWSEKLTAVGGSGEEDWAYDLAFHPTSTNVVYAATHEHGAYRSTDGGVSWDAINSGVSDQTSRTIEHDPGSSYPGTAYLGVFERTGIFKSTNGGGSWNLYDNNISNTQIYKLSIDPDDTDNIYLATFSDGVMKTSNGGSNWSSVGLGGEIILDVVALPGDNQVLLSGTYRNGLFRSTNGGGSWVHSMTGLNASTVSSVAVRLGNSDKLVAALRPGWTARSTDGGETWVDYHTNISDKYVNQLVTHPTLPHFVYALTESSGLYLRDVDSWDTWIRVDENLPSILASLAKGYGPIEPIDNLGDFLFPEGPSANFPKAVTDDGTPLRKMVFDPTTPLTAYLGTGGKGVFKTEDDGATWTYSGLEGLEVRDLVLSTGEPEFVYAATNGTGSVFLSPDGGANWGNLNLLGVTAHAVAVPSDNPAVVFAGTSSGIYKYDEGWTLFGLEGFVVYDIALDPDNSNIIHAGTNNSALISYDGGLTWVIADEDLVGIRIESIQYDPNDSNVVYYTTRGHGVLRISRSNP